MNNKHITELSKQQKQQQGFTLIEVLISMVILSIGLLGLAGLQTTGLRNNHSAYLSSQAAIYANDIFERMRANRTAAIDDDEYDIVDGTDPNSTNPIANQDLTEWRALVATLPSGGSSVTNNSGRITVVVSWDDSHASTDGSTGTRSIIIGSEL